MRRDFRNERNWNEWLAQRFASKETVYVVVNLSPCRNHDGSKEWLSEEIILQTARRFRNKLNQHYYGNAARRFGKCLEMTVHLHSEPHKHLHLVIEKPAGEPIIKFRSVIENICLKDGWLKPLPHFEMTRNESAAQFYNGRHGNETLILF